MSNGPEELSLFETPEAPVAAIPDSTAIAAAAEQHPIIEYEDHTSEAARDQGHGPQELGVPLEDEDHPRRKPEAIAAQKEAQTKRRRRIGKRENRYTDYQKDQPPSDPQEVRPVSSPAAVQAARALVDKSFAPVNADKIAQDSGNDPRTAIALAAARAQRREQR